MAILGERIKKARLAAGLSQQALADAISQLGSKKVLSRTAIAQWESGVTKEIEAANLLRACQVLNVTPEWLQFGTGAPDTHSIITTTPQRIIGAHDLRIIPLLGCDLVIPFINGTLVDNDIETIGLDEELARIAGGHTFAMGVKNKSMQNHFHLGDIVVIDPSIKPFPGEFVAAEIQNENLAVLRKYHPLGINKNGFEVFELTPSNQDWPTMTIDNEKAGRILGTLIEHRCQRRLLNLHF